MVVPTQSWAFLTESLNETPRGSNVSYENLPRIPPPRFAEKPRLEGDESHRSLSPNRSPQNQARIAIQPGWHIRTKNGAFPRVDPVDQPRGRPGDFAIETGAEDRVHDQIDGGELVEVIEGNFGNVHFPADGVIDLCVRALSRGPE